MRQLLPLLLAGLAAAQAPASPERNAGVDAGSNNAYALISTVGRLVGVDAPTAGALPRLTAQCTKTPEGKFRFEMLADFGGVETVSYIAPWKGAGDQAYPPPVETQLVTMEFLGYTKVKPVKRQWDALPGISGEWKYATPGMRSRNLEEIAFYLQYLRALPTLRLTIPGKTVPGNTAKPATAEWETAKWLAAVKAEPLCAASGL